MSLELLNNEMSDLITLLSMYVYQVFGLTNMKLMQTAEIKVIMVQDDFELSPNIVPVSLSSIAAARKQIKFRKMLLVISLGLPFINTLSSLTCKLHVSFFRNFNDCLRKKYFSLVTAIFDTSLDL